MRHFLNTSENESDTSILNGKPAPIGPQALDKLKNATNGRISADLTISDEP